MSVQRKYKVKIGITTYNRLELTKTCLTNLLSNTSEDYELIIADNGSDDGTREYLKGLYDDKIVNKLLLFDKNYGIAPVSNSIIENCEDSYYLKLDNDIKINRTTWLTELLDTVEANDNSCFIGYSFLKQLRNIEYPLIKLGSGHFVQVPEANIGGACVGLSPEIREQLGFWTEDYAPYGEEDTDYCARARLAGIKFYYMKDSEGLEHLYCPSNNEYNAEEYRRFKNYYRDRNISDKGAFTNNLLMYKYKLRDLKMTRKFKTLQVDEINYKLELNREYSSEYSKNLKKLSLLEKRIK